MNRLMMWFFVRVAFRFGGIDLLLVIDKWSRKYQHWEYQYGADKKARFFQGHAVKYFPDKGICRNCGFMENLDEFRVCDYCNSMAEALKAQYKAVL